MTTIRNRGRSSIAIAHVSSAHPWTDNRIHLREAASAAKVHRTLLVALESPTTAPETGVTVKLLPRRGRLARVLITSPQAVATAFLSGAQVVHLHDPELVWSIPLFRVAGRRVIYDAHEDLPEQVLDKSYIPRALRPVMAVVAHALLRLASTSDHIIAATEPVAKRFPACKTTVVHNFPPLRPQEATATDIADRPKRATYVGALTANRGAHTMAEAALSAAFPKSWELHLAGPSTFTGPDDVFSAAELSGRLRMHGQVSPEAARDLLLQSRLGIVVLSPTRAYTRALATKMFEYLAAGLPVIASDFPAWRTLLSGYDCATFIDPHDSEALAEAVSTYANDADLLRRHSRTARRAAVERFNWSSEEPKLLAAYARLGLDPEIHDKPVGAGSARAV